MSQDADKKAAALAAADEVKAGMLVGLGTGSTAFFLIDELGRRVAGGLKFSAVATSLASEKQAKGLGIETLQASTFDVRASKPGLCGPSSRALMNDSASSFAVSAAATLAFN